MGDNLPFLNFGTLPGGTCRCVRCDITQCAPGFWRPANGCDCLPCVEGISYCPDGVQELSCEAVTCSEGQIFVSCSVTDNAHCDVCPVDYFCPTDSGQPELCRICTPLEYETNP
eukprot:2193687-Rhodomonas_salina.1